MVNNPFISCVVISYNAEKCIKKCLESILAQDYNNFEIILVDDGSKDNTVTIAKKIEGVICYSKENGGIVSARTYGVERAKGEYIMFVDGDDYINPTMISSLVSELDSSIDILMSDQWGEDEKNNFSEERSICDYGIYNGDEYIKMICTDQMLHHMFPKLYKKEFLLEARYLNYPHITASDDLYTNVRLGLSNPKVKYINQINYYYQYNSGSVARKENPRILQNVDTIVLLENYFKENGAWDDYAIYIEYRYFLYALYYLQFGYSHVFKKEIVNSCKDKLLKIKNNEIWKNNKRKYSKAAKLLFWGYVYCPHLAFIPNNIIMFLRKCKNKS